MSTGHAKEALRELVKLANNEEEILQWFNRWFRYFGAQVTLTKKELVKQAKMRKLDPTMPDQKTFLVHYQKAVHEQFGGEIARLSGAAWEMKEKGDGTYLVSAFLLNAAPSDEKAMSMEKLKEILGASDDKMVQ